MNPISPINTNDIHDLGLKALSEVTGPDIDFRFLPFACMKEGVSMPPRPLAQVKPSRPEYVFRLRWMIQRSGSDTGLTVNSPEALADLLPFQPQPTDTRDWELGNLFPGEAFCVDQTGNTYTDKLGVAQVKVLTNDQANLLREWGRQCAAIDKSNKDAEEAYEQASETIRLLRDDLETLVRNARAKTGGYLTITQTWEEYKTLANGDEPAAWNFLVRRFGSLELITEAFAFIGQEIPADSFPLSPEA